MTWRICTVVGARPQLVKAAVVSRAIGASGQLAEILIDTGQHYDYSLSTVFFEQLGIPRPAHALGVGSGSHGRQTGEMLARIEDALLAEKPDLVMVYGDTNSTLAGALAATKLHIPLVHVEAGLRSFDRRMPEEINRVVADGLGAMLFAPTATAVDNLQREGIPSDRIRLVGDVMYDATQLFGALATTEILGRLGLSSRGYRLATIHRAENTDDLDRLGAIFRALMISVRAGPIVLPLHPRTRKCLSEAGLLEDVLASGLRVIEPVGYLDMLALEKHASLIATDSGGVQKEAFFLGTPCVTLRPVTEWVELVETGWNRLVDPVSADAVAEALNQTYSPGTDCIAFGDGRAGEAIAACLADEMPLEFI